MIDGEGQANQLMMMMMINGGRGQRLGLWGICRCGYPYMVTYRIRTRAHMHFCTSTELHTTTAEQEKRAARAAVGIMMVAMISMKPGVGRRSRRIWVRLEGKRGMRTLFAHSRFSEVGCY